ncbi:hypothetical protein FRC08_006087 [Ceratobasidium sp. 394]|nr:hypothetical protein FRC08_006087 [Ceratobasidium sp. 394]
MKSSSALFCLFTVSVSALHLPFTRRSVRRGYGGVARPKARDVQTGALGLDNLVNNLYFAKLNVAGKDVPVQVDTGSTDIWLYNYESNLLDTAHVYNSTNLTLAYGAGNVVGSISQINMNLAGFSVANQSFLKVQSHEDQPMIDDHLSAGILGLGFDSTSHISDFVRGAYSGATWGRGT